MFRDARRDSSRYELIRRNVSYQELKEVRKFPIFNMGKYKGGQSVYKEQTDIALFARWPRVPLVIKMRTLKTRLG